MAEMKRPPPGFAFPQGASAPGEVRPDTDSPCGLSVSATRQRTLAAGGPAGTEIDTTPPEPDPQPNLRRLASRTEIEHAIDEVLSRAHRRLVVFSNQLGAEWNRESRVDPVRRFCLDSRRNQMHIVLHDAGTAYRSCPRLLSLLRQFSHVISVQETLHHAKNVYDPFVLADDRHYLHRFHHDGAAGLLALDDPVGATVLRDRFEELWEASAPAIPATTIGL